MLCVMLTEKPKMEDLIYSGVESIGWLFQSEKIRERNKAFNEEVLKCTQVPLINGGVLISYSYLIFILGKESGILKSVLMEVPFPNEDAVHPPTGKSRRDYVIRRVRNALSHGYIEFKPCDKTVTLQDKKTNATSFDFSITIKTVCFGQYLNDLWVAYGKKKA